MWTRPDAEQLLIDYLAPILAVPVGTKAPGSTNDFVKVIRTGGPIPTPVTDRPQITIEAYSTRGSTAWALTEKARMALFALAGTVLGTTSIKDVTEIGGPGNLPDPIFPALTRYTFTLAVHLRGRQETP
jgi:hypothetical protein